jgi:hypothetical protein
MRRGLRDGPRSSRKLVLTWRDERGREITEMTIPEYRGEKIGIPLKAQSLEVTVDDDPGPEPG